MLAGGTDVVVQMHAGLLNFFQRKNCSNQFAFQRSSIVHLFDEFGHSEPRSVEYLETDLPALRQTVAGKLYA